MSSLFRAPLVDRRKEVLQQKQRSDDLTVQWNNCRLQKEEVCWMCIQMHSVNGYLHTHTTHTYVCTCTMQNKTMHP